MKRVGLLGLLLVMALGSGVMAQSPSPSSLPSPSPEPTPLFAPDDLAFLIPSEVKSLKLDIGTSGIEALVLTAEDREVWRDFLLPFGKVPTDVKVAFGERWPSEPGDAMTQVFAARVDGVAADALVEPMLMTLVGIDPSDLPAGTHVEWQDIDGRSVLVLTEDGYMRWAFLYPKGEVLFVAVGDGDLMVEDVLAELP